jgi:Uma2 family endonuclease
MAVSTSNRATIDDLHSIEGQAELIGGRIVRLPFHGHRTAMIVGAIVGSLYDLRPEAGRGIVGTSTLGYVVPRLGSGRESFCADASYYEGPLPENRMDFLPGPPTFAVEVRSENDHGPAAERAMAAKRADYFEAGTLVVWDVDYQAEVIHCYRGAESARTTFARGEVADAEPAVPGWTIAVDAVFG